MSLVSRTVPVSSYNYSVKSFSHICGALQHQLIKMNEAASFTTSLTYGGSVVKVSFRLMRRQAITSGEKHGKRAEKLDCTIIRICFTFSLVVILAYSARRLLAKSGKTGDYVATNFFLLT